MRVYKHKYRDRFGETRETKNYYIDFYDHLEILRTFSARESLEVSEETGRQLENLVALRATNSPLRAETVKWLETLPEKKLEKLAAWDIISRQFISGSKTMDKHIDAWEKALESKDNTAFHCKQQSNRLRRICKACSFIRPGDLSADRLAEWLHRNVRSGKMSVSTANHYQTAAKTFGNWLVHNQIVADSPFRHLKRRNTAGKLAHNRRELSDDECIRLLEAAAENGEHHGMKGLERALMYRVALETGLRWSELRSLTVKNLNLDKSSPTVTVEAAYAKNRREDTLPLLPATASMLAGHCIKKRARDRVFSMWTDKGAECLRKDLHKAGIPYEDQSGRVADFHSLRHTFISRLARSGVHPSVAQALARHSTITLTMDRYTHTALESMVEAVNTLPAMERKSNLKVGG